MDVAPDLLDKVLALPPDGRAELAHKLLLSLESDDADADRDSAWADEIERRAVSMDEGSATASDWREALERIRATLSSKIQP